MGGFCQNAVSNERNVPTPVAADVLEPTRFPPLGRAPCHSRAIRAMPDKVFYNGPKTFAETGHQRWNRDFLKKRRACRGRRFLRPKAG